MPRAIELGGARRADRARRLPRARRRRALRRDARVGGRARSGRSPISRKRIRARALFKTLELFGEHATAGGPRARRSRVARDIADGAGLDPDALRGARRRERRAVRRRGGAAHGRLREGAGAAAARGVVPARAPRGQMLSRVRLVLAPELRDDVTHALGL